jgi:DNA-damage-inducible protein J
MNATVAVNLFARAVLRQKWIPFGITGHDDPFYSLKNQIRLREATAQIEAGQGKERNPCEAGKDNGL